MSHHIKGDQHKKIKYHEKQEIKDNLLRNLFIYIQNKNILFIHLPFKFYNYISYR